MFDWKFEKGKWFWKADNSKPLAKKEHDLPAFKAIYGIEKKAKTDMDDLIARGVKEIAQKLISK